MDWHFGKYIEQLLDQKGGKKAGWHQSRLAEKAKLSDSYIGWIIRGETSGKKGPPNISIETIVALSKALGIKEQNLIDAYKGKEPDKTEDSLSLEGSLKDFLRHLPPSLIAEAMIEENGGENPDKPMNLLCQFPPRMVAEAIIQLEGKEKMRQLMDEALRRREERGQE